MRDFDRFIEEKEKKEDTFKLFNREWKIKHDFATVAKFFKVFKSNEKILLNDVEKFYYTIFSIALDEEIYNIIKARHSEISIELIKELLNVILKLWGLGSLDELSNQALKKK